MDIVVTLLRSWDNPTYKVWIVVQNSMESLACVKCCSWLEIIKSLREDKSVPIYYIIWGCCEMMPWSVTM